MIEDSRIGNYIETWMKIKFYPLDPRPEEINLYDIGRSLSHQCRFLGHINFHYSIAQHCVLLHDYIEEPHKKQMLMHDCSEAYLCDIPSPLKPHLTNYHELEKNLQTMIYEKYNIDVIEHPRVKECDSKIIFDEITALKNYSITTPPALGVDILEWTPNKAYGEFLNRAARYWDLS